MLPELNSVQQQAVDFIVEGQSAFALGGYAGTGKTVTAAVAAQRLGGRAVLMAPTNKAAAVLAAKTGMEVRTIHKATLRAVPVFGKAVVDPDSGISSITIVDVQFVPGSPNLPDDAVVIIDEASMVGDELWNKMQQAVGNRVPVVMIGDPFQLQPVKDTSLFHLALERWPSLYLTEVYRQEKGSKVLDFATALRADWQKIDGSLRDYFDKMSPIDPGFLGAAFAGKAVVLAYENATRIAKIRQMRRALWSGIEDICPQPGEPMIGYQNDPLSGIMNGFRYTVLEGHEADGLWRLKVKSEFGRTHNRLLVSPKLAFNTHPQGPWQAQKQRLPRTAPLTFSYAMTGHASQGSQWPYVMVENQKINQLERANWVYTAVTRATEEVFST